jgi:hypothetical protein
VPALEPVLAWRVVATPAALDGARWQGATVEVLRVAPDEALGIGATGVDLDDPDAIVEPDAGFSMALVDVDAWYGLVDHVEWPLPEDAGVLTQGKVAGVPAKVRTGDPAVAPTETLALVVVQTAHADELRRRLGW